MSAFGGSIEETHGRYIISTDPDRVDLDVVHRFLSEESYWARGRSRDAQRLANDLSPLVVGAYLDGQQVGFARMVTDLVAFGYLADVFVLPGHRGTGLGTAIVQAIVEHPELKGLKWQLLATDDAHGVYGEFGFVPLADSTQWMIRPGPPAEE
ncbi:MAG: GNAT family N-acetyltransferase [Actinomycetota bacterium]